MGDKHALSALDGITVALRPESSIRSLPPGGVSTRLRSVLDDWILVGLKLGHDLPTIAGIDLNRKPVREPVDSL